MNSLNISGNLTRDVEIKTTQNGKKVASFCIAVNKGKDKTFFLNGVAWEKTAELLVEYTKKGDRLAVSGELEIRKYEDKNGVEKYATEVIVREFDFPPKSHSEPKAETMQSVHGGMDNDMDSDIPFSQLRYNEIFNY